MPILSFPKYNKPLSTPFSQPSGNEVATPIEDGFEPKSISYGLFSFLEDPIFKNALRACLQPIQNYLPHVTFKVYPAGDREIIKDDNRKCCDLKYKELEKNIVWVESNWATVRNQDKILGKSPLGVNATQQIRFRKLDPFETSTGDIPLGDIWMNTLDWPFNTKKAQGMPPGSELEIQLDAALCEQIRGSFFASLSGSIGLKGGIRILIKKLPDHSISLQIERLQTGSCGLEISLKKTFLECVLKPLAFFDCIIQLLPFNLLKTASKEGMIFFGSLKGSLETEQKQSTNWKMSLKDLQTHVTHVQHVHEKTQRDLWQGALELVKAKILNIKKQVSHKSGVIREEKKEIPYTQLQYQLNHENVLGKRQIDLESMHTDKTTYWHMSEHEVQNLEKPKQIKQFFKLLKYIGVSQIENIPLKEVRNSIMEWTQMGAFQSHTDVYITKTGIQNIINAKKEDIYRSFLNIKPKLFAGLDKLKSIYKTYQNFHWWSYLSRKKYQEKHKKELKWYKYFKSFWGTVKASKNNHSDAILMGLKKQILEKPSVYLAAINQVATQKEVRFYELSLTHNRFSWNLLPEEKIPSPKWD